ncbi:MAG: hypothetical protein AAFN30_16730 [Actinomycetota bacterium]
MTSILTAPARRALALLLGLALVVAACGSDDDDGAEDTTTTTEAAATETDESDDEAAAPADGIAVELGEWYIDMPATLESGSLSFALTNVGENPHTLAVARGSSYDDLPQKENGAVDTDALGADFIGGGDNVDSGGTGAIDFDLEPGDYVFFCPIEFGPNSHAAAGQVLSVTVG